MIYTWLNNHPGGMCFEFHGVGRNIGNILKINPAKKWENVTCRRLWEEKRTLWNCLRGKTFTLTMKCFACGYEKSFIFQIENGYNKDRNIIFCNHEMYIFPPKGYLFSQYAG